MKVLDILTAPWAILPDKKVEIDGIYLDHRQREKVDIRAIEAALGRPLNNQPSGYDVLPGGIAVLPVEGVIAKRMNLFTQISGGVSTSFLAQEFQTALNDPSVKAIVLRVDSPGGAVDGTQEMANMIYEARGQKPIVALADGMMASAAYWIGSAADKVFASSDTTMVGSIGVVASHVDVSGAEAQRGVKTTEVTAGKFKRIASQYGPLSPEGRQSIQDQLDHIYGVFTDAVAKFRGVASAEAVHEGMADGRVFLGQQAVDAGLVDGIATLDQILADLRDGKITGSTNAKAGAVSSTSTHSATTDGASGEPQPEKENNMADATVKIDASEIAAAVEAEASKLRQEFEAKAADLRAEGANAERQRIQDVFAVPHVGHEDLIKNLAFDGKTSAPEAALQVLKAEEAKKADRLAALKGDAPKPAPAATVSVVEAKNGDDTIQLDPQKLAADARAYQDAEAAKGNAITTAQAVAHVKNLLTKKGE